MKKLFALVLMVAMLFPIIGVTEIDFASMTDEQLLQMNAELFNREKTAFVPMGWYIIGRDIPEGEYLLSSGIPYPASITCFVYESLAAYGDGDNYSDSLFGEYINTPSNIADIFTLRNGNVLTINDPPGVFIKKVSRIIEFK